MFAHYGNDGGYGRGTESREASRSPPSGSNLIRSGPTKRAIVRPGSEGPAPDMNVFVRPREPELRASHWFNDTICAETRDGRVTVYYNGNVYKTHLEQVPDVRGAPQSRLGVLLKLPIYRRSHYTCACVREPLEQTCVRPKRAAQRHARPHATGAGININIQQH